MSNINLHLGDCLELMKEIPDASVDLILTDPPYGMAYQSKHRTKKYEKIHNDQNLNWLSNFIDLLYIKMKYNSAGYIFCSMHHIDIFKKEIERKFKLKNILIWEKNNHSMGDLKASFSCKTEFIIFFQKGRIEIKGKRDNNILKFNRTLNINHPTEKPTDLLSYLINKFSNPQDIVFDPFMGSGSTGIACIDTNRKFVGIELDDNYYKIAEKRIQDRLQSIK